MFRNGKGRTFRAAVAGIAGAALLTLSIGGAAQAASTIDESRDGSATLTINKHEYDSTAGSAPNNGTEQTVTAPTIDGVEFTISRIDGIDLTTNAGWQSAATLAEGFDPADPLASLGNPTLVDTQSLTTGEGGQSAGQAAFTGLDFGLYLVQETSTPGNVVPAAPFLITLPLTNPVDLDEWLYDVFAYPKNSIIDGEKEVEDADGVQVGDEISYTIRGDIPSANQSVGYHIYDDLDDRLALITDSFEVGLVNGAGTFTSWTEGNQYEVVSATAGGFHIRLTEAGLAESYNAVVADLTTRIQVSFDTEVIADGEITNEAAIYPNHPQTDPKDGDDPVDPPITPEVETRWGGIILLKQATDATALPNAQFEVWTALGNSDFAAAAPITDDAGVNRVWTTGTDGQVVIDGLRYSNFANGETITEGDPEFRYYWLVEVVAPEGFELLAEPIAFQVTSQAAAVTVTVDNVPHNAGFEIPLTGGSGTLLFTLAGALLLAFAVIASVRRHRKPATA